MTKNTIPLDVKQHKTRLYPLSPSLSHTFQKPCFLVKFPYKITPILLFPTPFLALNDIQILCHSATNVPSSMRNIRKEERKTKANQPIKMCLILEINTLNTIAYACKHLIRNRSYDVT